MTVKTTNDSRRYLNHDSGDILETPPDFSPYVSGWGWAGVGFGLGAWFQALRATAVTAFNGSMAWYTPALMGVNIFFTRPETLLQSFASVARWSVGTGWCTGKGGCGGNMRNAKS